MGNSRALRKPVCAMSLHSLTEHVWGTKELDGKDSNIISHVLLMQDAKVSYSDIRLSILSLNCYEKA